MRPIGPRIIAVASVVCSATSAILTNLITSHWSWAVAVGLAVLALASCALAWWDRSTPEPGRTTITQSATGGSQISHAALHASGQATIQQDARHGGRIDHARLTANNALVTQTADNAAIVDADLTAES